jgi:transcriptional regulator GlxA family with amidase domain
VVVMPPENNVAEPLFDHVLTHGAGYGNARRDPPSPVITRMVEALLGALLVGPLQGRRSADPAPLDRAADRVRHWLREGSPGTLRLSDLAAAGGVSAKHLCRLAHRAWGMGPMEMARRIRLESGLHLLMRTNLPVQAVAHRCGFASPYHFSRRFRAMYGMSPSAARAREADGPLS